MRTKGRSDEVKSALTRRSIALHVKLDPVSRVTGIPGWYWILGIKFSDTTGVGLVC